MHLALLAAIGIPAAPKVVASWTPDDERACRAATKAANATSKATSDCLTNMPPERVIAAVRELIGDR